MRARCKMSNTHFSRRMPSDPTRFILVGTSHAGNVGATARAMKVMGFSDLVLVAPRFADVLAGARVAADLGEALDGITYVCATAMTPRDFGPPNRAPRELFATLAGGGQRVAFVFGSERFGLANDDVYACHACLTIPTDPAYGSLNLAQAVQLIASEWRQALGGFGAPARDLDGRLADAVAVRGLIAHWQASLETLGFLDPAAPKKLMARLQRLANRAELSTEEVHILRGIARAVDERCR